MYVNMGGLPGGTVDKQMADDLSYIKSKVDNHDKMMLQLVEITERQVASNDKLNDHIIRTDKHQDKQDGRMDKQDERMRKQDGRIDKNHTTILKWSGAGAAVVTTIGLLVSLSRLFPGLAS